MSKHWSENYLLTVNNDVEGWKIINMLKENQKLQLRGRHSDIKNIMRIAGLRPNHCNDIPVRLSGYIAVYLRK